MSLVLFLIVYISSTLLCIGLLILGLYQKNTNAICTSKKRLDGKTAIVTGGTNGMGLEIAKDFAERGARVIVACPFEEEGHNAKKCIIKHSGNENVVFEHLDLSSFASVRKFAAIMSCTESRLDILVNNAGVNNGVFVTKDGLNFIMQVNYFGTVLLTILLLPLLNKTGTVKEPSRIVNTTSLYNKKGTVNVERWTEPLNIWIAYRDSKLCLALFTRELAKRLQNRNVIVNLVEPGIVGTTILHGPTSIFGPLVTFLAKSFFKTPWEGAQTAITAAVSECAVQESGKCFYNCEVAMNKLSPLYYDDELCQLLWESTMNAVKFEDSVVLVK